MKKLFVLFLLITTSFVTILLFLKLTENGKHIVRIIPQIVGLKTNNILINPDFNDGLKGWKYTDSVGLFETNGFYFINIKGKDAEQKRIWQEINVVSGKTYRLMFTVNGPDRGAFAIYRDIKTGKEQYKWCNGKNINKKYIWEIRPERSGKNYIYLSTNFNGDYYYSNISLLDDNIIRIRKILYVCLIIAILLLFIICLKDYAFCFLFVILICFPVVFVDNNVKSIIENRNLYPYKHLVNNGHLNLTYGIDFNNWLNDHFTFRNISLQAFNLVNIFINKNFKANGVEPGKDKFYFLRRYINEVINYNANDSENCKHIQNAFVRFNDFCRNNNAKAYFMIVPYSVEIYPEKLKGVNLKKHIGAIGKTIESIKNNTGINLLYCYDTLINSKDQGILFFKTDFHWTHLGTYVCYKDLMNVIKQDNKNIAPLSTESYCLKEGTSWNGTFNQLNIPIEKFPSIYPSETKYPVFELKDNKLYMDNERITNEKGNGMKAFILGDSFTIFMKEFVGQTFSETYYWTESNPIKMSVAEKKILDYKPDIVIIVIYSGNFNKIKNWY